MSQDRIWAYYQNERRESFRGSETRLKFLAGQARARLRRDPAARVLNIGVGAGQFEAVALKLGLDVHSLDPNEKAIAAVQRLLAGSEKAKTGRVEAIPFPEAYFEAVVASELLEHLPDQILTTALGEINRVLVPGGYIIGTVPSREDLLVQTVICPNCGSEFHRWGHCQYFDPARLEAWLSPFFLILELEARPFIPWSILNWKGKLAGVLKTLLGKLGQHSSDEFLFFLGRKRPPHPEPAGSGSRAAS
ncbi:MAG: class I SAM-dependent methyltransferase [Thermodesulfobacteriota bacterium]